MIFSPSRELPQAIHGAVLFCVVDAQIFGGILSCQEWHSCTRQVFYSFLPLSDIFIKLMGIIQEKTVSKITWKRSIMNPSFPDPSTPLQPRSIQLPPANEKYTRLLWGPPEAYTFKSGCVELLPGESIGLHSTQGNEEMLITLSGGGELRCPGKESLSMQPSCVLYNPPQTMHDVVNTGNQPLRYIFVVVNAEKNG